jgi:puromycin-sensitive aminopeptidase
MGDKNFRLPRDVRPERYRFHVAPDLAARRFSGRGEMALTLDAPTRAITLHGVDLEISSAVLRAGGRSHTATVAADADSQTLGLSFAAEIAAGSCSLELEWSGVFHDDLRGLYLAGGVAVTQFEAADARRVFPCFDEPSFKAVWEISVETTELDAAVIGNGGIVADERDDAGRRTVRFAPTPRMSSYLVALVVGRLQPSEAVAARGVPIRTWAVPAKAHLASFAQQCAAAVLPMLEDYFGLPYVFGKLDQVGIPDFEAGAMENAGCITFREIALLLDGDQAPLGMQKRVAEVITHELAHQWFGNLVTMAWWDDLWLNEAFATWMAFKIVDAWKPGWRMWDDFEGGKAAALHLDALASTHPIHAAVANAEQATENFDLITYEKGGSMLRMIEGYLGEAAFRDGIRAYMREFEYSNAVADDLWRALGRASGQPINEIASGPRGWLGRGGYPLVEVRREGDRVHLAQRRFWADPEKFADTPTDGGETWLVPVVVRWADDAGGHESRLLLRERTGDLSLGARGPVRFVCANKDGAGFYRVRYTPEEIAGLARHGAELSPVERINLITDAWALFRAGAGPLSSLCDLLVAFGRDEDYAVLAEVVARLEALEHRYANEADRPALRRFIEELLGPHLAALGWEPPPGAPAGEPDATRLRRAAAVRGLALAARLPSVVAEGRARLLRSFAGDRGALDPNLLDAASLAAARGADVALFEQLAGRVRSDPDPAGKRRSLVSLASVETPALIDRAIALLTDELVPMQDAASYVSALLANRAARDRAFDDVRARFGEVQKKFTAPMLLRRLVESLGELVRRRAEVEAFLDERAEAFAPASQAVRQTRERLRLDEDVVRRAAPELHAWLGRR